MDGWRFSGVHHFCVGTSNLDNALAFYVDTLGLSVHWRQDLSGPRIAELLGLSEPRCKAAMLRAGEQFVELMEFLNPAPRNTVARPCDIGLTHVCLIVDDAQRAYEALSAKGVEFASPPILMTEGSTKGSRLAYFRDPDGNVLQLMQPPSSNS